MKFHQLALSGLAFVALAGCQPEYDPAHDYFSHANTDEFLTEHLVLDLDVDFEQRALDGTATLHMRSLHPSARHIMLDTRDLAIRSARVRLPGGEAIDAPYRLQVDETLGQSLEVDLPEGFDPQGGFELEISYRTSPGATALQWLPGELTAGGEHPMLFSQSQAIHARSWVPLQDSPAVRITYEATIRTPPELLAVMSANNDPAASRNGEYHFEMPQAIPSYLLAIAVGDFQFAPIGEDTGVYAEPALLEASVWEFGETQDMLDLAEQRFGPYEWGRYDLLILPPSFPYGGMENPRLSFITPSVIAGDRSLVSLIAHELAHSWSGNLVTNATWRDIWLNEGTTSYLEARLMEDLFSRERADEERVLAWDGLQQSVLEVPEQFQPLAPKILPSDGEDSQQGMQYAKGQFFLEHLEQQFGRGTFDSFLAAYFAQFQWQSVTTEQFLEYLDDNLLKAQPGIMTRTEVEEWLYEPGVPASFQPPVSERLASAGNAARSWAAGELPLAELNSEDWSPQATVQFINSLPTGLDNAQLAELDAAFGFSATRNAEIGRAWFIQVASRRYEPAYPAMREHLEQYGRMRLITPIYAVLASNGEDTSLALEIFAGAKENYHPITVESIERALAAVGVVPGDTH